MLQPAVAPARTGVPVFIFHVCLCICMLTGKYLLTIGMKKNIPKTEYPLLVGVAFDYMMNRC